jgi:hypothetical protein
MGMGMGMGMGAGAEVDVCAGVIYVADNRKTPEALISKAVHNFRGTQTLMQVSPPAVDWLES